MHSGVLIAALYSICILSLVRSESGKWLNQFSVKCYNEYLILEVAQLQLVSIHFSEYSTYSVHAAVYIHNFMYLRYTCAAFCWEAQISICICVKNHVYDWQMCNSTSNLKHISPRNTNITGASNVISWDTSRCAITSTISCSGPNSTRPILSTPLYSPISILEYCKWSNSTSSQQTLECICLLGLEKTLTT